MCMRYANSFKEPLKESWVGYKVFVSHGDSYITPYRGGETFKIGEDKTTIGFYNDYPFSKIFKMRVTIFRVENHVFLKLCALI